MSYQKQIFQTDSPTRWKTFVWIARCIIFLLLVALGIIGLSILKNSYPQLPKLIGVNEEFKPLKKADKPNEFKRAYKKHTHKIISENERIRRSPLHSQVRAGFYVNWDSLSLYSLRKNIASMNIVLPEWLFIDPNADTIVVQMQWSAYHFLDSSQAKIVPLLSNSFNDTWNHECVTRIVVSPAKRHKFISNIITIIQRYGFDGVSIDFEDLYSLQDDQNLVDFHQELYDSLHSYHLLATQCIPPFNKDYRITDLHKFNDYIFVMAYDEHFATTKPGPVSGAKWVEQVLDVFTRKIQPEKFVLCLAGYGYDWLEGGTARAVTFQDAISTAKETGAKIDFDNENYNLHYIYYDDQNQLHEVWFTDAATNYNLMRTQAEYGLAGVALWRLGSEDPRIWQFYNRELSKEDLTKSPTNVDSLTHVLGSNDVNYLGDRNAQILDVLSTPQDGKIKVEYNHKEQLVTEENYLQLPSSYVIKKTGNARNKEIVLTFDDGPDPKFTPQILTILEKEKVPAAFFMIGENMQNNIPLVKEIFDKGYEIGNHTFSHPNLANVSKVRNKLELNATRRLLEIVTNHSTILFRPPFNSDILSNKLSDILPVEESRKENYLTVGESIDPQDWKVNSPDTIMYNLLQCENKNGLLLLHDAGGDNRKATVEALPRIIQYYKEHGYKFGTIAGLIGRSKDELMPPVTNPRQRMINRANYYIVVTVYWFKHLVYSIFFCAIFLAIGRIVLVALLAYLQKRKTKNQILSNEKPRVSIIVPAFNENVNAVKTVNNLLRSDYPDFEIIFVNDGSTDNTHELVCNTFSNEKRVQIFDKVNGGKASALNFGIENATSGFVVCIDADTQLRPDAVSRLMESFTDENIGAVAGNVKVGNLINMLTEWQSIEYITAQNFDRRAFDLLNCITVVPGAIGGFRKSAINKAGGFTTDTLAEDCDLTVRILRQGYRVRNNEKAIALTEAPEHLPQFLKQRFRWTFGVFQTFWKNRDTLFRPRYKSLGMIAMPNILIFQIIMPLLSPLVDLLMILSIVSGNGLQIGIYYLLFQLFDIAASALAFSFEGEKIYRLWTLIPQRFTYRWLMYYILFKAIRRAISGELQSWGVMKRTGNVAIEIP